VRRLLNLQERAREFESPARSYSDADVEQMISSMTTATAHQVVSLSGPARQLGLDADKMQEAASECRGMVEQVQDLAKGGSKKVQARLASMAKNLEAFAHKFDAQSVATHKFADSLESVATDIGRTAKGF